jgi:nitrite reductase (NO-forming)
MGLGVMGVAGLLVALFAVPVLAGPSAVAQTGRAQATTVTVTATEFKFKLSKAKVPRGKITFKVVNHGKLPHDFKIAGKKTKLLKPGQSTTLTVTITKSGRFAYLCTVPGHAAAGMKGKLAVGTATPPPPTTTTVTTSTTTTATTTTTPPPPGAVAIQVIMTEFAFQLSQTSVPVGTTVVFTAINQGRIEHDFSVPSLGATTPNVAPGQSATLTVTFKSAGQVPYLCTLPQHAEAGMQGSFTVTG